MIVSTTIFLHFDISKLKDWGMSLRIMVKDRTFWNVFLHFRIQLRLYVVFRIDYKDIRRSANYWFNKIDLDLVNLDLRTSKIDDLIVYRARNSGTNTLFINTLKVGFRVFTSNAENQKILST